MKIIKSLSIVLFLFISVIAIGTVFYFFHSKGDIQKVPSILGFKPLTILSNSMKPTFSAGDVVLINVYKEPRINEVVTYKHPQGMLVTHRIIGKVNKDGKTFYQSKGDNNNVADDVLIPRSSIIGVEEFVIPNAGYLAKFVSGPIGFFIFIIAPLLTLVIIEIFQRLALIEKRKQQIEG